MSTRAEAVMDARWQAILQRDEQGAGEFLYGVKTTGVFCRPACRSRRPRRENVLFFDSVQQAEHAGFRPCLRCRPTESCAATELMQKIVMACRWLEEAPEPSLAELARAAGLSPAHFQRVFKRIVGQSPKGYAKSARVERLRRHLRNGRSFTRALYAAGFAAPSRAYAAGARGSTQNAGEKQVLRFAVQSTGGLGWILVAGSDAGVSFLALSDDPVRLHAELRDEFPCARLQEDSTFCRGWIEATEGYLRNPCGNLRLPLDARGSEFRRRVWSAISRIPAGQTRSYAEIAVALGDARATRAVATACAANPVALAIPCHRVVGKDGQLRGYRWGIRRKRALLAAESGARH